MSKKEVRLGFRSTLEHRASLECIARKTGLKVSALLEMSSVALVKQYKRDGKINIPFDFKNKD